MVKNIFMLSQIGILVFVVVYFFKQLTKRKNQNEQEHKIILDIQDQLQDKGTATKETNTSQKNFNAAQLTSAFPSWTEDTAPHRILGVPENAKPEVIEMAHKILLKKYHPDRFVSWGGDYQQRAHQMVLLINSAKDRMLQKK